MISRCTYKNHGHEARQHQTVWTRTPGYSALRNPHLKKPLRKGGAHGGSGSNPLNWIPIVGSRDEPYRRYCGQTLFVGHVRLERRVISLLYVLSVRCRHEAPFEKENTVPPLCLFGGWWSPKNHRTAYVVSLITVCLPPCPWLCSHVLRHRQPQKSYQPVVCAVREEPNLHPEFCQRDVHPRIQTLTLRFTRSMCCSARVTELAS